MPEQAPTPRLMRLRDVVAEVAISKAEIYKRIATGQFPVPMSCGPRAVRWRSDHIAEWIGTRKPRASSTIDKAGSAKARQTRNATPRKK